MSKPQAGVCSVWKEALEANVMEVSDVIHDSFNLARWLQTP
jgi:hypothetical protein